MQPTMHRPNWDDPSRRSDDTSGGGLGAVIAMIAIVVIAIFAMTTGGDPVSDTNGKPSDTAITETDPSAPVEPMPSTIAP